MDLDEWVRGIEPRLVSLEMVDLRADFTRDSLTELERLARGNVNVVLAEACAGYLGETLLRVGGGRWIDLDDAPAVSADPALGLDPVVPADLLGVEGQPTATYDLWAAAAAAAGPGWKPVKEPTPGLDQEPIPESEALNRWLAEREAGFPDWVRRWAPDGTWDFSPESLDRLAELCMSLLGNKKAVDDPANDDLVDTAAWYVGETCRRVGDGRWAWRDGPWVVDLGAEGMPLRPRANLKTGMRTPGYLSEWCEDLGSK